MKELIAVGGLAALAYVLMGGKLSEITAAEGTEPLKKIAAEIHQAGEGFGQSLTLDIIATEPKTYDAATTSAKTTSEESGPFGGYQFTSEKEYRKAVSNPEMFWSHVEAGFEWTKSGRQAYKAAMKEEARQAKAAAAGYSSFSAYQEAKARQDYEEEREYAIGIAAAEFGGDTDWITTVASNYPSSGYSSIVSRILGSGE